MIDVEIGKIISIAPKTHCHSCVDWLSFMINEKMINDKRMIEHMKPVLIRYYEDTFLKNASADERDSKSYQQFKKLYRAIKK